MRPSDWSTQTKYWPLIGRDRSRDVNADLWLVNPMWLWHFSGPLPRLLRAGQEDAAEKSRGRGGVLLSVHWGRQSHALHHRGAEDKELELRLLAAAEQTHLHKLQVILTTVHYWKPGRHYPHVLKRPFLVFLMASEAFLSVHKCYFPF